MVSTRSTIVLSTVTLVTLLSATPFAGQDGDRLSGDDKRQIVERVAQALRSTYVTPDVGARMSASLMEKAARGGYDSILDPQVLADTLTADLRSVYRDLHLSLQYETAQRAAAMTSNTAPSVERVQVLDGNVGYFQLNGFVPTDADVAAAMKALTSTDALIIDLRTNTGGAAPTFLAGYFFEKPTLIARITFRPDNTTSEMWTEEVPGPLYLNKPLYVVTSRRTFSAAEAFAYHLKHFQRAVLVGETTGGGGHRVMGMNVGRNLVLMVPFARPVSVVTGTNWEGTGVVPDVDAPAEIAVAAAHLEALRRLPANAAREGAIARLSQQVKR